MRTTIRSRRRYLGVLLVTLASVMMAGCQKDDQGVDAPLMKNAPPPPPRPAGKPMLMPGAAGGGGAGKTQ